MNKIIYIIFSLVVLTSCYQEIDVEKYRKDPKIVMNSFVSSDSITVKLSRSWFVKDGKPENNIIEDANVSFSVNGKECGVIPYISKGVYKMQHKFLEGDVVKLSASKKGMKDVFSEVVVPKNIKIENVDCTVVNKDETTNNSRFEFKVRFTDAAAADDFYGISLMQSDLTGDEEYNYYSRFFKDLIIDNEPLLKVELGIVEGMLIDGSPYNGGFYVFNDSKINGQTYTLNLGTYMDGLILEMSTKEEYENSEGGNFYKMTIFLYKLSEGYYKFCDSMGKSTMDDFGNMGLAEPVRIYTNISGGIGLLGAYTVDSHDIYLKYKF